MNLENKIKKHHKTARARHRSYHFHNLSSSISLLIKKQTLNTFLSSLFQNGFIERTSEERREVIGFITDGMVIQFGNILKLSVEF